MNDGGEGREETSLCFACRIRSLDISEHFSPTSPNTLTSNKEPQGKWTKNQTESANIFTHSSYVRKFFFFS